jgi:microcystin-dependent protein
MGAGTGTGGGTSGTGKPTGGDALTARSVGAWGGEEEHLLTGAESGTSAHGHPMKQKTAKSAQGTDQVYRSGDATAGTAFDTGPTDDSTEADASEAHNNVQPFVVVNYIIRT